MLRTPSLRLAELGEHTFQRPDNQGLVACDTPQWLIGWGPNSQRDLRALPLQDLPVFPNNLPDTQPGAHSLYFADSAMFKRVHRFQYSILCYEGSAQISENGWPMVRQVMVLFDQ